MFSKKRKARSDLDAAFAAWTAWREAAERVQAAWDDVLSAARGTRAGAYAMYIQALRQEEAAARELGLRTGLPRATWAEVHRDRALTARGAQPPSRTVSAEDAIPRRRP
jgi:hypothetical protein